MLPYKELFRDLHGETHLVHCAQEYYGGEIRIFIKRKQAMESDIIYFSLSCVIRFMSGWGNRAKLPSKLCSTFVAACVRPYVYFVIQLLPLLYTHYNRMFEF